MESIMKPKDYRYLLEIPFEVAWIRKGFVFHSQYKEYFCDIDPCENHLYHTDIYIIAEGMMRIIPCAYKVFETLTEAQTWFEGFVEGIRNNELSL